MLVKGTLVTQISIVKLIIWSEIYLLQGPLGIIKHFGAKLWCLK